jgi:hypothetical protein
MSWIASRDRATDRSLTMPSSTRCLAFAAAIITGASAPVARAQTRQPGATAHDSAAARPAPPIGRLDASALAPGRWSYATALLIGSTRQPATTRTLTVEPATRDGQAAWLVVDTKAASDRIDSDSLFVTRATFTPLLELVHRGAAFAISRFVNDSVKIQIQTERGPAAMSVAMPRGTIVNGAMLEVAMRLLPLAEGWAGHVEMLAVGSMGGATIPIDLRLEGVDTITVPAGTFSCWRFSRSIQGADQRFWIDRKGRALVKMSTTSPSSPDMILEMALTGQS